MTTSKIKIQHLGKEISFSLSKVTEQKDLAKGFLISCCLEWDKSTDKFFEIEFFSEPKKFVQFNSIGASWKCERGISWSKATTADYMNRRIEHLIANWKEFHDLVQASLAEIDDEFEKACQLLVTVSFTPKNDDNDEQ